MNIHHFKPNPAASQYCIASLRADPAAGSCGRPQSDPVHQLAPAVMGPAPLMHVSYRVATQALKLNGVRTKAELKFIGCTRCGALIFDEDSMQVHTQWHADLSR